MKNAAHELIEEGWQTPNTYCNHFSPIPDASGVYALIYVDINQLVMGEDNARIMYIGMSKNVSKRLSGHEIIRELSDKYIQQWFKEIPVSDLRSIERSLIERFNPPYNIIGRRRGI